MKRRLVSIAGVLSFFGVAIVLLLSDRAPLVFPMLSSGIRTIGRRVEAITGIDVIDREQIPFDTDLLGHAALWFCGMVVVGFALRRRIPTLVVTVVMIAIGIGFEFGQFYWTQSRHLSVDDAIANAVGIVAGAIVVMVLGGIFDAISYVRRRLRARAEWVSENPRHVSYSNDWSPVEPTAAHEPVASGDPWIPPGFSSPSYVPASTPTWRYGSAAQAAGSDSTLSTQSAAAPSHERSPWAPPDEPRSPWAPPDESRSPQESKQDSRSPWAPSPPAHASSHAPWPPEPLDAPSSSRRALVDTTNEHPAR